MMNPQNCLLDDLMIIFKWEKSGASRMDKHKNVKYKI